MEVAVNKTHTLEILLIEDNPADVFFIKSLLKTAEINVSIDNCKRLGDATQLLKQREFDVILLDLGLPDSIGLDTLYKIKAADLKAPIIVLTGLDDENLALSAVKEDAQDYLVKNKLDAENIKRSIKYSIERKKIQEIQKRHTRRFSILSLTTSAINLAEDIPSIYVAICESVKRLLNDTIVIALEFIDHQKANVVNGDWLKPYFDEIKRTTGIDICKELFLINEHPQEVIDLYQDGKLHEVKGGIFELCTEKYPQETCTAIEKMWGIYKTYATGFSRNEKYYGGVIIFSNNLIGEEDIDIIEAISCQASLSIHRKTVENDLKISEKRYRSLFSESPVPKWENDFSAIKKVIDKLHLKTANDIRKFLSKNPNKILTWMRKIKVCDLNQAVLDLHRAASKEHLLNNLFSIFDPENYENLTERFATIAEGKTKFDFEMDIFTMDGEKRQVLIRWAVAAGHEETLERVLLSVIDITETKKAERTLKRINEELEQKVQERTTDLAKTNSLLKKELEERTRMEKALQESETQFKLLFNKMTNGFALYEIILDNNMNPCDYKFVRINPAFEKLTGLSAEKVLGKRASEVLTQTEDYWVQMYGKVALTGKSIEFENYYPELKKHFQVNAFCPKKGFFATIFEDITFKKKAIQAIGTSEERYRTLVEKSNALICEIDTHGKFVYVNSKYKEILGYDPKNLIGDYAHKICEPAMQKEFSQKLKLALQNFESQKNEWLFRSHSGDKHWFSCISSTFINRKGETHINQVSFDITETVKDKEQIKKYTTELKDLNATKDKFFGIIAHDLRNPFTSLLGSSELLYNHAYTYDKAKIKEFSRLLNESAKQGYALLENLLEWSKSQTGRISFDPQQLNIQEIITLSIRNIEMMIKNKNIQFESVIIGDNQVFADPNMLTTILRNLLINAVKFTHQGGKISVIVQPGNDKKIFCIKDNGIGIPKQDIDKLFRIDVKYSQVGTAKERGTGLGLLLCKEFVEKHGGTIWVESKSGKGSEFKFTIPN